jgi:hypothetical protein
VKTPEFLRLSDLFLITSNVRVDVKKISSIRLRVIIENILGACDNLDFIRLKDFPCVDREIVLLRQYNVCLFVDDLVGEFVETCYALKNMWINLGYMWCAGFIIMKR